MSVLTCKMCGGDLEWADGMSTARCPYCGTRQTIPRIDNDRRIQLYERANHFRRRNDYDMAMEVYEQLLHEDQTDSEAYWSIVLCRYGIEYVEDPATHKRIPTVNRTQYTSILADEDYKAALRYADAVQVTLYEQEAVQIDTIQKGILQVSGKEPPYDIFICYKEADETGQRTKDSALADEVYYHLCKEGYRVFFSRITLQDKLGEAYEPYIFAALHSAKIMIVIGTDPQNLQSPWVKNEWSRYLALIQKGEPKVLIPAYRDMDPYDLPKEFSHLQALNMAQLGFMQDLLHGVRKIIGNTMPANVPTANMTAPPLAQAPKIAYQPAEPIKEKKSGWEPYGWKRGVVCAVALVVFITLLNAKGLYRRIKMNQEEKAAKTMQTETAPFADKTDASGQPDEMQAEEEPAFQGILAEFLTRVYQVPAQEVTEKQLAKIQQLTIESDFDVFYVGYSFEAPGLPDYTLSESDELFESRTDELIRMEFPKDSEINLDCLYRFGGLKKLDLCQIPTADQIKGLQLESLSASFDNPAQVLSLVEDPTSIKELKLGYGADTLDGIEEFENLEVLYLDSSDIDNIDALISLKQLKHLTLNDLENLTDFAVIGKLSSLETLRFIYCESLRSIDFISQLENLKMLGIRYSEIQNLYGLENCTALTSLSVLDCYELKDLSTVEALTALEELALDVTYGCPEPKLEHLSGLKKLSLSRMQDCSFIENLSELTELHLTGCTLPDNFDGSKLSNLKTLSFTYQNCKQELTALKTLRSLEKIDMHGTVAYIDLAGLFNMPNLRELNLNDIQCEINFDNMARNDSLEILHMNNVLLYKNIYIENEGGIESIYYDDVDLADHMDVFLKFPSLKELYLCGNGLTDLSFAEQIPTLEILDISNNYITSLSPLTGLPSLRKVICGDNPLKSAEGLGNSVEVIQRSSTELE